LWVAVEVARTAVDGRSGRVADESVVGGKRATQVGAADGGGVKRDDAVTDLHNARAVIGNAAAVRSRSVISQGAIGDVDWSGAVVGNSAAGPEGAAFTGVVVRDVSAESAVGEINISSAVVVNAAAATKAGSVIVESAFGNIDRSGPKVENAAAKVRGVIV
jgi:hypothetical protein